MSEPLLIARGVGKTYRMGAQELPVLQDLELTLMPGEAVAVVGASGVGKSTLLHVLGLLDTPDSGEVLCGGAELSSLPPDLRAMWRNRMFGFVFQFYHLIPELTALENTILPGLMHVGADERSALREKAKSILVELGLGERLKHRPSQLSGGERQRVAIARALVNEPAVLLCDEPTGNLDPATSEGVQDALWSLRERRGQAMLLVTHDEELAARADRVLRMVDGRLEEVSRRDEADTLAAAETAPVAVVEVKREPPAQTLFSLEGRISLLSWWFRGLLPILVLGVVGWFGIGFLVGLAHWLVAELLVSLWREGPPAQFVVSFGTDAGLLASLILFTWGLFLTWPFLGTLVKRCHDRNRSGYFLLAFFGPGTALVCLGYVALTLGWIVPAWIVAGVCALPILWVLVELLIRPGTKGANRFGADPVRPRYGYRPG